jgi:endonuclease YncB( thermonuclease family)
VVSVVDILDPTTIEFEITWEPAHVARERVRLWGITVPEPRSAIVRQHIKEWLQDAGPTEVVVCRAARDSEGRLVGRVVSSVKGDLSAELLRIGAVTPQP